jgi:spore germination cell wall hydrolase CwlJ-like protein
MSASRHRPKGGGRRCFGLVIFFLAMMPTPVGFQDLAALIARQPAVSDRWRQYVRVTPFGTVQAATFSFPQPLGTLIPATPGYTFASLDPRALDITGSIGDPRGNPLTEAPPPIQFPAVDRTLKGDLLVPRERLVPLEPQPHKDKPKRAPEKTQDRAQFEQPEPAPEAQPKPAHPEPATAEARKPEIAAIPPSAPRPAESAPESVPQVVEREATQSDWPSGMDLEFAPARPPREAAASLPSGMDLEFSPLTQKQEAVAEAPLAREAQPGPQAEAELPPGTNLKSSPPRTQEAEAELPSGMDLEFSPQAETKQAEAEIITDEEPADSEVALRSEIKRDNPADRLARLFFGVDTLGPNEGKLQPWREGEAPVLIPMHPSVDPDIKRAAIEPAQKEAALKPDTKSEGETVAPKGEVTGEGKRPMTPAERLGLSGASRAKHERCLANAVYFEARGESERGQMAVAQVVLNRAFSGYYPDNVCGVVYQNAHRHLACQFTFACDGIRDVVTEPEAWEVAKRIARDTLDGKIWLPEIGKSTHYHAYWVRPSWVNEMKKLERLGVHTFYRPRAWGDGAEAPAWGSAATATSSAAAARM